MARILIAGGGIAGLASALALARGGHRIELFEQASAFGEVGAGLQLGPNATRRLVALGLAQRLEHVAAQPGALVVHDARGGGELARLRLGAAFAQRYGAPYLCIARPDLHALLLGAARDTDRATLHTGATVTQVRRRADSVDLDTACGLHHEGDALVGADGLWSTVRSAVVPDAAMPRATGHTAWRALIPQCDLPASLRSGDVRVWLGPRLHMVAYPVGPDDRLNVVAVGEAASDGEVRDWDRASTLEALQAAIGRPGAAVQGLIDAMPGWRAWSLHDRAPLSGPGQMALGRVALVGDAAHPMLPYLAQGAGMAIEDAVALAQGSASTVIEAFARYAQARWQRNARVQARARRNGELFHAAGATRAGRDVALRLLGARLLDQPWLYRG